MKSLNCVQLFATQWTVAYQASQSMGFFQARVLEWGAIAFSEKINYIKPQFLSVHLFNILGNIIGRQHV